MQDCGSLGKGRGGILMENVFFGLFLCGLTACFFPPVSGFSDEWLRPKWVLAEVVALLLLMAWGGAGLPG